MLRNFFIQANRSCTTTTPKISIPYAIKRTPTELLEALNSTVGIDKTAPHFAFIDDPITIPSSEEHKTTYFLSKELGKRAARHLAAEWPTLFMYDIDEPRLPIFRPTLPLSMTSFEGTEEELVKMIEAREVKTAVECYEKIRANGINISEKVQMDLFKLIVYYNENDIPNDEIEENHALRILNTNYIEQPWIKQGLAELMFETIEKTPEIYSILIAGMCKHSSIYSIKRAKKLYDEMLKNNMIPSIEAINGLISVSKFKDSIIYLQKINELKIQPNVDTMNACIMSESISQDLSKKLKFIQKLFFEFRFANVKPNLYTYSLVINFLQPLKNEKREISYTIVISVLDQIVEKLENDNEIKIENANDREFFKIAMNVAIEANNSELVERIEKIYTDKKNTVKLIGLSDENRYYMKYLIYNMTRLPLLEAEELYKKLVPRVCEVHPGIIKILMNRLELNPQWSFIKRIIDDSISVTFIRYGQHNKSMRKLLLAVDTDKLSPKDLSVYKETLSRCLDIWTQILIEKPKFEEYSPHNLDVEFIDKTKELFSKYLD